MPSTRAIEVLATAADLFHAAAEEFVRAARTAIGAQGRFTVALSGGSTPKALYSLLATNYAGFAWNRIFLFFGDERHVPPTDPESNYRMVNESLLTKIAIPAENVFRVPAENPDAAAAASEYEAQLRRFFEIKSGEFPRFDLILLGLGPEVQCSPNHFHFPRAQSRRRSDIPGQWRGQSRHGASGSRGQEHASTALAKGAAIRRKIVVDARRSRRRKTNSLKSGSFSVLSCQFSVNNWVAPSGRRAFCGR